MDPMRSRSRRQSSPRTDSRFRRSRCLKSSSGPANLRMKPRRSKSLQSCCRARSSSLSATLAIEAARLSLSTGLAMADSIILATARAKDAVLWTQDVHFKGLDNVEFREKRQTVG